MKRFSIALAILLLAACGRPSGEDGGGRAVIQNKGSDTLVNVAQAWAEEYKEVNPNVAIAVTGGGSGTGISAMINGTVDIANASRKMKDKEIEAARENGIEPVEYVVGFDALAVFLHPDNPVGGLHPRAAGRHLRRGRHDRDLGPARLTIPGCDSDEIVRVSRQNNSGTYVYFQEAVLGKKRDYKLGSRDMHGSKDVVDLVENTPCAIGYSGLAYATEHVKMPCVATDDDTDCVAPSVGDRHRRHLSDRPAAVHVHRRPARGRRQGVPGLDPQRRRPVHHRGQGLRPGSGGGLRLSRRRWSTASGRPVRAGEAARPAGRECAARKLRSLR